VQRRRRAASRASARADGWWIGRRAAFERSIEPARQHARGGGDMAGLARVRGAGERQLRRSEAIAVGGAAFDQRQRLQRLDRRARIDRALDVALRQHAATVGIDHRHRAAMPAFDQPAAQDFDQDGIAHC
jgi:hypothetical protein